MAWRILLNVCYNNAMQNGNRIFSPLPYDDMVIIYIVNGRNLLLNVCESAQIYIRRLNDS